MRAWHVFVGSAAILAGCSSQVPSSNTDSLPKSPEISAALNSNDSEMKAAVAQAQSTLAGFIDRLHKPQHGEVFSVEAPFPAADGSAEYLWLGDVTYKDGVFSGTVDTKPTKATAVQYGQQATAKRGDVADWMILRAGHSEGGYTVKLQLQREAQPR